MESTNLRQASAKITVVGTLSDMELTSQKTDDGVEFIGGYLTIKTSDKNFARFNVRVNKFKKGSTEISSVYNGLCTVKNEYKSISEVGEELADKLSVTGDINPYTNPQNNITTIGYRSNFFNRYKGDNFEGDKKSEFAIELFITQIVDELDKEGEETGRKLVKGWLPTYSGIEPITLVAEDADVVNGLDDYEAGQTVTFYGEAINNSVKIVKEIPVKLGKPRQEISYENRNELVITGATEPYEEGCPMGEPYEMEAIKKAVQERNNALDAAREATRNIPVTHTQSQPSAAAKGRFSNLGF